MALFKSGDISETKLGYILAEIEYKYHIAIIAAEDDLSQGKIDEVKFEQIAQQAKLEWLGK